MPPIVAFAPGGVEAMSTLAFVIGLDPQLLTRLMNAAALGVGLPWR